MTILHFKTTNSIHFFRLLLYEDMIISGFKGATETSCGYKASFLHEDTIKDEMYLISNDAVWKAIECAADAKPVVIHFHSLM